MVRWFRGEPDARRSDAPEGDADATPGPAPRRVDAGAPVAAKSTVPAKAKPFSKEGRRAQAEARKQRWSEVERQARALERDQRAGEAAALLRKSFKNLARHEETSLPCLCRRCLAPEQTEATASAQVFYRDWAARDGRVLFYWAPIDLIAERESVRRSVRQSLGHRLRELELERRRQPPPGKPRINPFTKLPM